MPISTALIEALAAPAEHKWPDTPEQDVAGFSAANPGLSRQMVDMLVGLAKGAVQWAEVLSLTATDLAEMGQMAVTFVMQGRIPQAEEILEALTDLAPTVPLFWLGLGDLLEDQNKLPEALEAFNRCVTTAESIDKLLPEALIGRFHRGAILVRSGDPLEAAQELLALVRSDPEPVGDRAVSAAMGVQALLNEGKVTPEVLGFVSGAPIGNGWIFEGGHLSFGSDMNGAEPKAASGSGGRLFASSQLNQNVTYSPSRFRADQSSFRMTMKFANLARPQYKRGISRALASGDLQASSAAPPDKARQRLINVLAKRRPEEVRGVYHKMKADLGAEGRIAEVELTALAQKGKRLFTELRNFFRHRATAAQLDRSYRNAQTVEMRASRVRAGAQSQPQAIAVTQT